MICEATRVFFYASLLPCCQDQKVSWHATPFEERLLKVLSDEKPRHERFVFFFFLLRPCVSVQVQRAV
jgi:hypothetical protein